jgi:hypothetical protein
VENVYRLQIMNTTETVQRYRIAATGLPAMATDLKGNVSIDPAQAMWVAVAVRVPPDAAAAAGAGSHPIAFAVERLPEPVGDGFPYRGRKVDLHGAALRRQRCRNPPCRSLQSPLKSIHPPGTVCPSCGW